MFLSFLKTYLMAGCGSSLEVWLDSGVSPSGPGLPLLKASIIASSSLFVMGHFNLWSILEMPPWAVEQTLGVRSI